MGTSIDIYCHHWQADNFAKILRAQRLTASKELELKTLLRSWANALGAQRLTASKELEPSALSRFRVSQMGAQRLTASKELERGRNGVVSAGDCVLNALRHQRNWNLAVLIAIISASVVVLNALRHQRNWNLSVLGGIQPSILVLNALRHQRNWNSERSLLGAEDKNSAQRLTASKELELLSTGQIHVLGMCSTPYGIKGIGTAGRSPSGSAFAFRAQRLTASKELEPPG